MAQEIDVRRLTSDDMPQMREVLYMLGHAFDDVSTYTASQPSTHYLADLLSSDLFIALAAYEDCTVIGGLAAVRTAKIRAT